MAGDIVMPRLSDSMQEGTVVRWLKGVGESVTRGEPIVEIETDKATITYESDTDGMLAEILVHDGETVEVGAIIARITDEGSVEPIVAGVPENTGESEAVAHTDHESVEELVDPQIFDDSSPAARAKASPIARRLARKLGIEVNSIKGTGPGGRVVKEDVEAAASAAAGGLSETAASAPVAEQPGGDGQSAAQPTGAQPAVVPDQTAEAPAARPAPLPLPTPQATAAETPAAQQVAPASGQPAAAPAASAATGSGQTETSPQPPGAQQPDLNLPPGQPPAAQPTAAQPLAAPQQPVGTPATGQPAAPHAPGHPPPLPTPPQPLAVPGVAPPLPTPPAQGAPIPPLPVTPPPLPTPPGQMPAAAGLAPQAPGMPQQPPSLQVTGQPPLVPPAPQSPASQPVAPPVLPVPGQPPALQPHPAHQPAAPGMAPTAPGLAPPGLAVGQPAAGGTKGVVTPQELSIAQQTVARRMSESKATAPDYYVELTVDMTAALAYREQLKLQLNPAPTVNDFVLKAAALALRQYPRVNASYKDGHFELYGDVNVGVVAAAADFLAVPVLNHADQKGLAQVARESRDLVNAVRGHTVQPAQLAGGTFTISNLGMYGIDRFTAIINPPQAAILAVGAIKARPVVAEDGVNLAIRQLMSLTLSCDHRILYGTDGAEFLNAIKAWLESPQALPI